MKQLSDIGEAGFLAYLGKFLQRKGKFIDIGYGDDAAVITPPKNSRLVLTTDMLIAGVHFIDPIKNPYLLGRKSVAVNLSDLAAMGAQPLHTLVSLGIPPHMPLNLLKQFYRGMVKEAGTFRSQIIGGDTVHSQRLVISITQSGTIANNMPIPKRGLVKPGNYLYVTGSPGESGAGLEILLHRQNLCDSFKSLVRRHLTPTPRIEAGRWISRNLTKPAMIDISDGLYHEIHLLSSESSVGFEIDLDALFISQPLRRFCTVLNQNPERFILFGGEDYELLFTTPDSPDFVLPRFSSAHPKLRLRCIGKAIKKQQVQFYSKGTPVTIQDASFEHFSGRNPD